MLKSDYFQAKTHERAGGEWGLLTEPNKKSNRQFKSPRLNLTDFQRPR